MTILQISAIVVTTLCVAVFIFHFIRIMKLGAPKDLSSKSGSVTKGILYSNTVAMLPHHKESAYLHLPTYTMGIIFHIGIFIALLLYIFSFFTNFTIWLQQYPWLHAILLMGFIFSSSCGIILVLKRFVKKSLRQLSHIDDFLSCGLVTLFQCMTLLSLFFLRHPIVTTCYYISAILLLLYMPVGKLKHLLYFFAARYHLGFFYGWRNVWPPKKSL
jgi:hypothetical protein